MSFNPAQDRYGQMAYRRVGMSGLKLPEISLGLWHNFGSEHSFSNQRKVLRRAFDLGITHFDLANNYGPPYGEAELNFGDHLEKDFRSFRDELIISTKAGYDMWEGPYGDGGSRKYLLASLDQSLKRMGLDYVDIFYSHRFDATTPLEETMSALATAVQSGKALYVGISNYDSEQTQKAQQLLREKGVELLIHQPKYSMLHRIPEQTLFDTLGRIGLGAIVFSPLAQGLLTDKYLSRKIPKNSRITKGKHLKEESLSPNYLEMAKGLNDFAKARSQSLSQLALSWVLRHEVVASALIGASSVLQLEQNHAAINSAKLSPDELREIDRLLTIGAAS
ncbi:MAG: L-glyceraldehyde 3-phosphate reductase [Actinomycetota bacterium]